MTENNVATETIAKPAAATTTKLEAKPGYKTTEFWLSAIATVAGLVMASGLIVEGSTTAQIIGGGLALLTQLGYTASRTQVKKG